MRLRLDASADGSPGVVRLRCADPLTAAGGATTLIAPNGTRIDLVEADPPVRVPELRPSLVVTRAPEHDVSGVGRAGMRYRDLVPDRQGGRFIASHITIPDGGPVPDYVHYHRIRFQLIFCRRGWVRVVYEDQGEPFLLEAGDCVLQPPEIRHRVLEASPGMEVIELACPAQHETRADLHLELPTARRLPDRDFGGQRFVRHHAAGAPWAPWHHPGFEQRDTGIGRATDGLAGVRVVRPAGGSESPMSAHGGELLFWHLLDGTAELRIEGRSPEPLRSGDSAVVPPGRGHALAGASPDLELLEVTLPEVLPPA